MPLEEVGQGGDMIPVAKSPSHQQSGSERCSGGWPVISGRVTHDSDKGAAQCLNEISNEKRLSFPAGEQPTSSRISSSSAQRLHSGIQHSGLASFVLGMHYAPLRVGIELRRASCRWRVTGLALSICEAGSHFHHGHVSGGPPIIPDSRISRGPV